MRDLIKKCLEEYKEASKGSPKDRISLDLEQEEWDKLRMVANSKDKTVQEFIEEILANFIISKTIEQTRTYNQKDLAEALTSQNPLDRIIAKAVHEDSSRKN